MRWHVAEWGIYGGKCYEIPRVPSTTLSLLWPVTFNGPRYLGPDFVIVPEMIQPTSWSGSCWLLLVFPLNLGGHFICKTFDLFTPFSVGLIYLLYCCFERVCLFKPITSRPANSERWGFPLPLNQTSWLNVRTRKSGASLAWALKLH